MPRRVPSQTRLKQILRDSSFDPRADDGPNSVIVDAAVGNPRYAEDRAIELIREAQLAMRSTSDVSSAWHQYVACVLRAIGLLALALAVRDSE
jgi:hypothetical protein